MGSLLVVTGPPGAGKSTVAEELARSIGSSVLVEGDAFFRFLRNDAIDPWLPEANDQNTTVTQAAGSAAGRFAQGGLHTVYDGVIGPWFLDVFLASTGLANLDYVVLLPPAETCVERVLIRENHGFTDVAAARHMHDQFASRRPEARHILDHLGQSPKKLARRILDDRTRGDLRYEAK